jgi:hypothetical protein
MLKKPYIHLPRGFGKLLREIQPVFWIPAYNLACLAAGNGDAEKAMSLLQQAVSSGFHNMKLLEGNEDLATVHKLPGFQTIIKKLQELS